MTAAPPIVREVNKEGETADWRPHLHFTPWRNWINDPNGLVYFEGEYHLFYQYNPHGNSWGHMSWGHAVSADLVSWTELPLAIPEREFMVFSGCALVDWSDTSGLGDGLHPPLLAYFTAHHDEANRQSQCLAYSHDQGRSWIMYGDNPLIDLDLEHHRDPNVFWHAPSRGWVMAIALPRQHQVEIYRSTNLVDWARVSVFGPAGSTGGQWECPALFEVPDEAPTGRARWVLKVDVDRDLVAGGSGAQYFVGEFDGYSFTPDSEGDAVSCQIADFGRDFYAAITWSNLPDNHTNPIWVGWMSNHQTGRSYPTSPWRGAMTIPREIFLFQEHGVWRLGQRPVSALIDHFQRRFDLPRRSIGEGEVADLTSFSPGAAELMRLAVETVDRGVFELAIRDAKTEHLTLVWDSESGALSLHDHGGSMPATPTPTDLSALKLEVLWDACSVEIFINDGRRVFTRCIFPIGGLVVTATSGRGQVVLSGSQHTL